MAPRAALRLLSIDFSNCQETLLEDEHHSSEDITRLTRRPITLSQVFRLDEIGDGHCEGQPPFLDYDVRDNIKQSAVCFLYKSDDV